MANWDDSLLIGVPHIDDQHRKLVEVLNELTVECGKGKWSDSVEKTLFFAVSYAKDHFRDEEELQAQSNYPGLEEHRQMHQSFVENVSALLHDLRRSGKSILLVIKINKMLNDWIVNHISTEDKKIGLFIQSKEA